MKTKALAISLTIMVCFVLLEAGLRVIGRSPTNMADGVAEQYEDSFRLKKNITKHIKWPAFTYTIHTNAYGFRDKRTGHKDLNNHPFFAFLGASDVFGNGVEFEESFVGIFAEAAQRRGFEVVNLAVGGHYFLDQEDLLRDLMDRKHLKPSTVFLCMNALHIPKFDRRNQNVIVKDGYIIDKHGWRIAYIRLLAGNHSAAFCFLRDGIRRIQERYLRYELNEKAPEFLRVYAKDNPIRQTKRINEFYEYLSAFNEYCQANAAELVIVYLPLSNSFDLEEMVKKLGADSESYDASFYEELIISYCRRKGINLINARPALEHAYNEGNEIRFKLDPHFNEYANRIIGEFIIESFMTSRSDEKIPSKQADEPRHP